MRPRTLASPTTPAVTGELHVRFYAGLPLINSGGFALGTLCVVDTKPRELSFDQVWALESLRKHVVTYLDTSPHLPAA